MPSASRTHPFFGIRVHGLVQATSHAAPSQTVRPEEWRKAYLGRLPLLFFGRPTKMTRCFAIVRRECQDRVSRGPRGALPLLTLPIGSQYICIATIPCEDGNTKESTKLPSSGVLSLLLRLRGDSVSCHREPSSLRKELSLSSRQARQTPSIGSSFPYRGGHRQSNPRVRVASRSTSSSRASD